jgi:hypothetical protein
MRPYTDSRKLFIACSILFTISAGLVSYLGWHQERVESRLKLHGLDRVIVLEPILDQARLNGEDASRLIAFSPRIEDGTDAVLTHETSLELKKLPFVADAFPIARLSWELKTEKGSPVSVQAFVVPPEFLTTFKIKSGAAPKSDVHFVDKRFLSTVGIASETESIQLSVPSESLADLPSNARDRLTPATTTFPVRISSSDVHVPLDVPHFYGAMFTTKDQPRVSIGGVKFIPMVKLFVNVREEQDFEEALGLLTKFARTANAAQPGARLVVTPARDYFLEGIGGNRLQRYSSQLLYAVLLGCGLMMMIATLTMSQASIHEAKLRHWHGASSLASTWRCMKRHAASGLAGAMAGIALADLVLWGAFGQSIAPQQMFALSALALLVSASLIAGVAMRLNFVRAH